MTLAVIGVSFQIWKEKFVIINYYLLVSSSRTSNVRICRQVCNKIAG